MGLSTILRDCVCALDHLESSIWWIHEDALLDVLGVQHDGFTLDNHRHCVCLLIKLLKIGKLTAKVDGVDIILQGERLVNIKDLDEDNSYKFWMQLYGSNKEKWFNKGNPQHSLNFQHDIINTYTNSDLFQQCLVYSNINTVHPEPSSTQPASSQSSTMSSTKLSTKLSTKPSSKPSSYHLAPLVLRP